MSCALLSLLLLLLARPCHVAAAVQSGSRQSCYPICSGCTTFFPLFFLSSLRKKKKEDSCTWSWSEKSGPVGRDDSARFWPVLGRSKLLAPFRLLPFISLSSSSSSTLALPSSPSSDGQVPLRSPSLVRWWPCLWLPFDRLPFTTADWNRNTVKIEQSKREIQTGICTWLKSRVPVVFQAVDGRRGRPDSQRNIGDTFPSCCYYIRVMA